MHTPALVSLVVLVYGVETGNTRENKVMDQKPV